MADLDQEIAAEALRQANGCFADAYARRLADGFCEPIARAYAEAVAQGFLEGFLESVAACRRKERARLEALHDGFAVHGPDAQRWLMALELGSSPDDAALQPPFTLSN